MRAFPSVNGIQGVVGKPGGGKGAYAMEVALWWLTETNYKIVGNFALSHGNIAAYLAKYYPDRDFDLFNRIVKLTDSQAQYFYRYRSLDDLEKPLPYQHILTKAIVPDDEFTVSSNKIGIDYHSVKEPVLYLVDEAQNLFNNRAFAETGFPVRFYLSQHRKMHDVVLLITQQMGLVDKSFRAWCQNFIYCRNLSKEMVSRLLRAPKKMRRITYLQALESNSQQEPESTVEVDFDLEILNCYDTNAGVGISSQVKGAENVVKKGFSTKWILYPAIVGVVVLAVLMARLPKYLAGASNKLTAAVMGTPTPNKGGVDLVAQLPVPTQTSIKTPTLTPSLAPPQEVRQDKILWSMFTAPKRVDLDTYVSRLRELDDVKVIIVDDTRCYVTFPPKYQTLIPLLDAPVTSLPVTLSIHSFRKTKDFSFSLDKLDLKADSVAMLLNGGAGLSLNLGKLIMSFGRNNLNYLQTDTYKFNLIRGSSAKVTRGVEIPILNTITQNNATTTTTTYKAVLNSISITPRFAADGVYLKFDMSLQNLIDTESKAISTTTLTTDLFVEQNKGYILLDLANLLKQKSNGFLSFSKSDEEVTYVITLDSAAVCVAGVGAAGTPPPASGR